MDETDGDQRTLRRARADYFAANGFGENGGYDDAWVDFSLGPLPFPFPNTRSRVRAVAYHDLHHILTGYPTTTVGEFEISAWELGAGCKDFGAAWVLNLSGAAAGMVVAPRRIAAAFARGRRDNSLYGEPMDRLLDLTVEQARRTYLSAEPPRPLGWEGTLRLAGLTALGVSIGSSLFLVLIPLAPVGFGVRKWLERRSKGRRDDRGSSFSTGAKAVRPTHGPFPG